MKRSVSSVFLFSCILWFGAVPGFSAITLKLMPSGKTGTVGALSQDGELVAAVPEFFEQLGFKWQWDASTQQLTCVRNLTRYVLTQDVQFYTFNGALLELPAAPRRIGATLYLAPEALADIYKETGGAKAAWDPAAQTLTVGNASQTITSVTAEKKQNGVVVTVELADSVPFECSYTYPNVTLNFLGATVAAAQIRLLRRVGIVDSLFAVQSKESAQVSLRLTREIEEPQIDYVQDMHTVLVSLRPKKAASEKPAPEAVTGAIQTIVIDPGHGGIDPGAIGPSGKKEKDLVLGIALELRDLLKKNKEIRIFMTREKDDFVPLGQRTRMANERKADLFVSIHANAISGSQKKKETTRGYKAYFLSQAKNEEDKLAAMRENAVIQLEEKPQNYGALKNVLINLAGDEYLRESQDLCILVDQRFTGALHQKITRQPPGIGQANFWVLNGAYMPSILIETGYITSPDEERLLSDRAFQKEIAAAIYEAVMNFKKKYETGL
jgi:N-acetylmuramoyl-L-alanine amidase